MIAHVENLIDKIATSGLPQRNIGDIRYIVIHRFGSHDLEWYDDQGIQPTLAGAAKFYRQNPEACKLTGGELPYPIMVGLGGNAWQGRKLTDITPHAAKFNIPGLGIGFFGDFRYLPPTKEQWNVGIDICAAMMDMWPHLQIVGHTYPAGLGSNATHEQGKQCPGRLFEVTDFAAEVKDVQQRRAGMALLRMGIQL